VILGTVAVENPDLVREAARAFPGQVAVGIDAKGRPRRHPRLGRGDRCGATDLARRSRMRAWRRSSTPTSRAMARWGPNVAATEALARAVSIPVIASGGCVVAGRPDRLREATGVIAGAISGRALYDGAIDLAAAIALLKG
jgi:phosphoribosylformimino-5-aminoimidazole carboxamide ribotide isomerase